MHEGCPLGREQLFQAFSGPVKCQALMQDALAAFSALLELKKEMRSSEFFHLGKFRELPHELRHSSSHIKPRLS